MEENYGRRLLWHGTLVFLLGLVIGIAVPAFTNPRMGLSAHIQTVLHGMVAMILGLLWPRLRLSIGRKKTAFICTLAAVYSDAAVYVFAAITGASGLLQFAGGGSKGAPWQETLISAVLIGLTVLLLAAVGLVLWGLRGAEGEE